MSAYVRSLRRLTTTLLLVLGSQLLLVAHSRAAASPCARGFEPTVVHGKHLCRAAVDLGVDIKGTPAATRVDGTTTYVISAVNAGRRSATNVALVVTGNAIFVSTSTNVGSCNGSEGTVNVTCGFAALAPGARVEITVVGHASALGELRLSARSSSASRDSRPRDNSATFVTRVLPPDTVTGHGVRPTMGVNGFLSHYAVIVDVNAVSAAGGEDAAGTFSTQYPVRGLDLRGRVVCMSVAGNRASVGGIIEATSDAANFPVGSGVVLSFTDNGDSGAGPDAEISYLSVPNPMDCPVPFSPGQPDLPLDEGDFVVTDTRA